MSTTLFSALLIGGALLVGCSNAPSAVPVVDVDPDEAGQKAIELHDADGDGLLSESELSAVPALLKNLEKYDADGDGAVSAEEIAARVEVWFAEGVGIRSLPVTVLLDGRPLADAVVEFEPEAYLGPECKPAIGIADRQGVARMTIRREDLPPALADRNIPGVQAGVYKIRVTHPARELPARYNSETTLGEEIAKDTVYDSLTLELQSK